jgi:hypothetical protein
MKSFFFLGLIMVILCGGFGYREVNKVQQAAARTQLV